MKSFLEIQLSEHIRFQVFTEQPTFDLKVVKQVHGSEVLDANIINDGQLKEADGIAVYQKNLIAPINLAIKTADCLPIALVGVGGMAMLHAGWRGLASSILASPTLTSIKPILAYIGPAIREQNYQVSPDFKQHFPSSKAIKMIDDKYHFNLVEEAHKQLKAIFPAIEIIDS